VWYEFDKDFHLVTAYADEEFRSSHAQFYAKGKDAHPFSPEEQPNSKKSDALSAANRSSSPARRSDTLT